MPKFDYDIFDKYFDKKISEIDFFYELKKFYENDNNIILKELSDAFKLHDSEKVYNLIYTICILKDSIEEFNISNYIIILDDLLISDWHRNHEDIVSLIEKISDCRSIEYLYKALFLKPEYLSWDENYAFEKKCIHAIAKIDEIKSISLLKKISNSNNIVLNECASNILERILKKHKNEIRAVYNDETIRVYQAYNNAIAAKAVELGTFGSGFKMDRMTWIKPSFLWMMYRCGWATKDNQEHVLAIDIKREGFDYIINNAIDSKFIENVYGSKSYWDYERQNSDVICQWDPERDINGNPLEIRSVQLGLRGDALDKYVREWIVSIEDITDYVNELKILKDSGQDIENLLPDEKVYIVSKK